MNKIVWSVLALLVVASLSSNAQAQCRSDTDCKGARICQAGRCVYQAAGCTKDTDCPGDQICRAKACTQPSAAPAPVPAPAPPPTPAAPAAQPAAAPPLPAPPPPAPPPLHGAQPLTGAAAGPMPTMTAAQPPPADGLQEAFGSVHANVLGLLGFGVMPAIEFGTGGFGAIARLRFMQAGVASHFVYPDTDEDETLDFSIGVSIGGRWYTSGMRGFYLGGMVEWSSLQVRDDPERKMEVTQHFATAVDIGYRFKFNRFLLGLGCLLGVAAPLDGENQWYDGHVTPRNEEVVFFGAAMLELGFYFLR